MRIKLYEKDKSGKVIEHDAWSVDANECVAVDPERFSLTDPRAKADAKAEKKADAKG